MCLLMACAVNPLADHISARQPAPSGSATKWTWSGITTAAYRMQRACRSCQSRESRTIEAVDACASNGSRFAQQIVMRAGKALRLVRSWQLPRGGKLVMPAVCNRHFQFTSADLGLPGQKCRNAGPVQEHRDGDVTPTGALGFLAATPLPRQLTLKPLEANVGATSRRDQNSHIGIMFPAATPLPCQLTLKPLEANVGATSRRDHHSHMGSKFLRGNLDALPLHLEATSCTCGSNVPSRSKLPQRYQVPPKQPRRTDNSPRSHSEQMWERRPVAISTCIHSNPSLNSPPLRSR